MSTLRPGLASSTNDALFSALTSIGSDARKPATILTSFGGMQLKSTVAENSVSDPSLLVSASRELLQANMASKAAEAERLLRDEMIIANRKNAKESVKNPLLAQIVSGHTTDVQRMISQKKAIKKGKDISKKAKQRKDKALERGTNYKDQTGFKVEKLTKRKQRMQASKSVY